MKDMIINLFMAIAIAHLLIFVPLYGVSFDTHFYEIQFDKHGRVIENQDAVFFNALDYVQGKDVSLEGFNQKERKHFEDVRHLYSFIEWIILVSLGLLVLGFFTKKYVIKAAMQNGAILSFLFLSVTSIMSLINFKGTFFFLHKVLFTNDLWLMDPTKDIIIRMMPESLFVSIASLFLFISVLYTVIVYYISRKL